MKKIKTFLFFLALTRLFSADYTQCVANEEFIPEPEVSYKIRNKATQKIINVTYADHDNNPLSVQAVSDEDTHPTHGMFTFVPAGDDAYYIKNRENGKVLNVNYDQSNNYPLRIEAFDDDDSHPTHRIFTFVPVRDGFYYIKNAARGVTLGISPMGISPIHSGAEPFILAWQDDVKSGAYHLFKFERQ